MFESINWEPRSLASLVTLGHRCARNSCCLVFGCARSGNLFWVNFSNCQTTQDQAGNCSLSLSTPPPSLPPTPLSLSSPPRPFYASLGANLPTTPPSLPPLSLSLCLFLSLSLTSVCSLSLSLPLSHLCQFSLSPSLSPLSVLSLSLPLSHLCQFSLSLSLTPVSYLSLSLSPLSVLSLSLSPLSVISLSLSHLCQFSLSLSPLSVLSLSVSLSLSLTSVCSLSLCLCLSLSLTSVCSLSLPSTPPPSLCPSPSSPHLPHFPLPPPTLSLSVFLFFVFMSDFPRVFSCLVFLSLSRLLALYKEISVWKVVSLHFAVFGVAVGSRMKGAGAGGWEMGVRLGGWG